MREKAIAKGDLAMANRAIFPIPSTSAREERERAFANALASVRMEGQEPPDAAKALFQRYVDGALTAAELEAELMLFLDKEYGPERLAGNPGF